MLFINSAGKWSALIVTLLLVMAIVAGFLLLPSTTRIHPITTECTESAPDGPSIQKQVGTFTGWEWITITVLVGVIIGMTVGIALSRPPIIHS